MATGSQRAVFTQSNEFNDAGEYECQEADRAFPSAEDQAVDIREFYAACDRIGLQFGSSFCGLQTLQRRDSEAFGTIELPASAGSSAGFALHPAAFGRLPAGARCCLA